MTHVCADGDGCEDAIAEMQRIDERNDARARSGMRATAQREEILARKNTNCAIATPQLPLSDGSVTELVIADLEPAPFQYRIENPGALRELTESLKQDGQIEPIIVREIEVPIDSRNPNGRVYQIVAGHRRVAALKLNGAATVRAEIHALDDEQAFRAALIDNMKRHDLDPLDEARIFEYGVTANGWTPERIADWIGRPREFVAGRLRLLKLDPAVTKLLEERKVSIAVAEVLQTVAPIKGALPQLVKRVKPGDSLRDVEREVEGIFRNNSIELDNDTPFAWKEECARLGCLAKNPRGKPVCLSRENYVRLTVELNKDAMAAAIEKFRGAHPGTAAEADVVYYDLSDAVPGYHRYGYKRPAVKGFPAPPAGRGSRAPAKGIVVTVPSTRTAFAQGKIPVAVLKPPQPKTDSYGHRVQTPEAKATNETRAKERARQTLALQEPLKAAMIAAVDALAKKPARALAAGMVTRYRASDDLQLVDDIRRATEALHIKLPLGNNKGDGLIRRLMALGEAKLVRIFAAAKIWKLDDPVTYLSGGATVISAKRLKGQLPLLLGAKAAAAVLRDVEELQSRMTAEARTAARADAAAKTAKPGKKPKARAKTPAKKASKGKAPGGGPASAGVRTRKRAR